LVNLENNEIIDGFEGSHKHNDSQHNGTQHDANQLNNTQHNDIQKFKNETLSVTTLDTNNTQCVVVLIIIHDKCCNEVPYAECHYTECHHAECLGVSKCVLQRHNLSKPMNVHRKEKKNIEVQ
jgi:hypothetical protein